VPSSEILPLYEQGKLHSGRKIKGKKRKIVKSKAQAKAILLSYLRKEHRIPARKNGKTKSHNRKRVALKG
jgi:hypothetical protein